jgi:glutamine cyclotransferase
MVAVPDPGQTLLWTGGQIDVRVEVDTGELSTKTDPDWQDISGYVLRVETDGGTERWGQRFTTGRATVTLDNTTGVFSSESGVPNKPFDSALQPGRRVRIIIQPDPTDATVVSLFTGVIDSVDEDYRAGAFDNTATLNCFDNGAVWTAHDPAETTSTGTQLSSDRVHAALDRMAWEDSLRDVAPGNHDLIGSTLARSTWEECQRAAEAEGGAFFAGRDGKAVFKDRDWLTRARGDVIQQILAQSTQPQGITWDGTSLWYADDGNDTIYELNPATGAVISSFASPALNPRGLTWDGTNLWLSSTNTALIYKLTTTGTVLDSFAAPGNFPRALGWDGTNLWVSDFDNTTLSGILAKLDPADGTVLATIPPPAPVYVSGMDFKDGFMWLGNTSTPYIHKVDPTDGTVLDTIHTQFRINGVTWANNHLWVTDGTFSGEIYRIEAWGRSGFIPTGWFPTDYLIPGDFTFGNRGLAWDGTYLWFTDAFTSPDSINQIDPADGTVISTIPAPAGVVNGLTWDGTNLWMSDSNTDLIYKIDPSDGTVLDSFASPDTSPQGLAWDGTNLWVCDPGTDLIYKLDPADGTVIDSFASPASSPRGLTWDGTHLWHTDQNDTFYRLDPTDGSVLESFSVTSYASGTNDITWDGTSLWVNDVDWGLIRRFEKITLGSMGYLGYADVPDGAQAAHIIDISTSWELARVRNQIRFAREGGVYADRRGPRLPGRIRNPFL